MKIKTIVYAQTLNGIVGDEGITDNLNDLLAECEITPENLIDIKINTHPVYNIIVSEDTYLNESSSKYMELETNSDFVFTRYVATIVYKTEE